MTPQECIDRALACYRVAKVADGPLADRAKLAELARDFIALSHAATGQRKIESAALCSQFALLMPAERAGLQL